MLSVIPTMAFLTFELPMKPRVVICVEIRQLALGGYFLPEHVATPRTELEPPFVLGREMHA
jgi:hypothetical protein